MSSARTMVRNVDKKAPTMVPSRASGSSSPAQQQSAKPSTTSPQPVTGTSNASSSTSSPPANSGGKTPISDALRAQWVEKNDEQEKRLKEARKSIGDLLDKCKGVTKGAADVIEMNKKTKSASEEIDDKWNEFKRKFDEMNRTLINNIGAALGQSGLNPNGAAHLDETEDENGHLVTNLTMEQREQVFETDISLKTLCRKIRSGEWNRICVMAGAGISVSAGIPDFRSKDGLYERFKKEYGMTNPQLVFDISYFKKHPEVFCARGMEMCPGKFKPTKTHYFLKLLELKGILQRVYTQNIDTLEKQAGLPDEKMVYAHGSFADCHCIECGKQVKLADWRTAIENEEIPRCGGHLFSLDGKQDTCTGLVKPDIVFFGEDLPSRFAEMRKPDFKECDCLIVLGTSLQVSPFNSLIQNPKEHVPRVLINNEKVGTSKEIWGGFRFDHEENYRDLFLNGSCDATIEEMAQELGWKSELDILQKQAKNCDGWKLVSELQPTGERSGLKY